jgi:hypothetical protein
MMEDTNMYEEQPQENTDQLPALDVHRVLRLIETIENDVRTLRHLVSSSTVPMAPVSPSFIAPSGPGLSLSIDPQVNAAPVGFMQVQQRQAEEEGIEGIFDGERMIDATGKNYQVPPNYASKSKLVEGDPLKLYITREGKYLYKQLGPVERRTVPGQLRMEGSHYVVDTDEGITYNILTACVTYYMSLYGLKADDRVMATVPADRPSKWAVIENII